jgi:hypothetical protein
LSPDPRFTIQIKTSKSVGYIAEIMKGIAKVVGQLQCGTSAPQINELIEEIDLDMQDVDAMQEMNASGMGSMNVTTEVTSADVDSTHKEID